MTKKRFSKGPAPCLLLPTDFQQPARRAFAYGVKLATALGFRLEILHVIKTVADSSDAAPNSRTLHSLKTAALLELGRQMRVAQEAGVRAEPCLQYGVPDSCIVEFAARLQPRMIVMGTEGRTGWDRLRLGSTAQAIVRGAACPVLAVHGGVAGDVVRHPARVRLERMLLATDFSSSAGHALKTVSILAQRMCAAVCVVHAVDPEADLKRAQRRLDQMRRGLLRAGLTVETACVRGEPVEAILTQSARWQPDVIAVGTQGKRGLRRVVLGSVAEGVLRRAGCPVLVVKRTPSLPPIHEPKERRQAR